MNTSLSYNIFGEFEEVELEQKFRRDYYSYNKNLYFFSYILCSTLLLFAGLLIDYERKFVWGSAHILTSLRVSLVLISLGLFPLFWKKDNYSKYIEYHGLIITVLSSIIVLLLNTMTGGQSKTMLPGILIITASYYIVIPSLLFHAIIPSLIQIANFSLFYDSSELLPGGHIYMCFMIVAINCVLIYFKKMHNKANRTNFLLKEYHQDLIKAKDTVLSIIGHDLKNPLTVINNRIRLMRKFIEYGDTEKIKTNIDSIDCASTRLTELLHNLLDWALSKDTTDTQNKASISTCIENSITLCKDLSREKNIEIIKEIKDCSMIYDSNMMNTIIRNLLVNSIKYSKPSEKIFIRSNFNGDKHIIELSDHGIGMSDETKLAILRGTNKDSIPGTEGEKGSGLGLKIALDFIKRQGGDLEIESSIGAGTTFRMTFQSK